jgi:hypothetical protein
MWENRCEEEMKDEGTGSVFVHGVVCKRGPDQPASGLNDGHKWDLSYSV